MQRTSRAVVRLGVWAVVVATAACAAHTRSAPQTANARASTADGQTSQSAVAPWTYPEGLSWGAGCESSASGLQQSPIDFTKVASFTPISSQVVVQGTFDAHDQNVVFVPTVSIDPAPPPSGPTPSAQGSGYTPSAFHLHWHAEHKVADSTAALEMHIKTQAPDGTVAVFAILWAIDDSAPADATLTAVAQAVRSYTAVDLGPVLGNFASAPFYSYLGSLTTPPCTTMIRWYVLETPLAVTRSLLATVVSALAAAGLPITGDRGPLNFRNPKPLITSPALSVYRVTPIPPPKAAPVD